MHTATLRALGGSVAVTLPRPLLKSLGLECGHQVAIAEQGNTLVLSPARPRYKLADLVAGMKPGDLPQEPSWDALPAVGKEAW
jgi:antitoxin component of MazEF toxin-antitoxin module